MATVNERMILYVNVNVNVTFLGAWWIMGRSFAAEIANIGGSAAEGAARLRLLVGNIPVLDLSVKPPPQMVLPGCSASES